MWESYTTGEADRFFSDQQPRRSRFVLYAGADRHLTVGNFPEIFQDIYREGI
jgi:hypothetical protein